MSESNDKTNSKDVRMFVVLGFTSLGLLVGSIAGLSSADLTLTLFGLVFAFAGGSVIAFMGKMPKPSIVLASIALASFCLAAVMALYVGLFMKVNEILFTTPKQIISAGKQSSQKPPPNDTVAQQGYRTLMRARTGEKLENYLTDEVASGNMTLFVACEQLSERSLNKGKPPND
jgi:mannitol-specific phosphotransferase system IIBC component